jgi:hypothetical protein
MTPFGSLGKLLIFLGGLLIVLGVAMLLAGKIPWLGRLPGDLYLERRDLTFFPPLTTSILVRIILSLVLYLIFSTISTLSGLGEGPKWRLAVNRFGR